jgi:hypothetical protein
MESKMTTSITIARVFQVKFAYILALKLITTKLFVHPSATSPNPDKTRKEVLAQS